MTVAFQDPVPQILVLPNLPAADSGAGQRSLLLLEAAAALGPVHVVILSDGKSGIAALPGAASLAYWGGGTLQRAGLFRHLPLGALRLVAPWQFYRPDPALRARMEGLVEETGARAILFRYVRTFCAAGMSRRKGLAILVDVDDRDDQKYASRLMRLFGRRLGGSALVSLPLRRLAGLLRDRLRTASLVWFAGAEDAWTLPGAHVTILPNVPAMTPDTGGLPPPSAGDSVLFVGVSGHVPNQDGIRWFLDHCWADLARRCPDVRLRIVGRGTLWPQMAARYSHLERVDFVGPVDDLAAEYGQARLCICPVREGGGSKIKVIEAAAMGRPIVGVSHAFCGFDQGILDHAVEAATPQDFVAACADILTDGARADRAGAALAEWQRQHYSRNAILTRIRSDIISVRK